MLIFSLIHMCRDINELGDGLIKSGVPNILEINK